MTPYDQIRQLSVGLYTGEQRGGELCPFCRGGRTGERSFSFTKTVVGAIVYQCKRGSCGRTGRVDGPVGLHNVEAKRPEFTPRHYTGTFLDVPEVISEYYIAKFGFSDREWRDAGVRWSPEYNRTVWRVCSPSLVVRGYELRDHTAEGRLKTLHYRHSPDEWLGWFPKQRSGDGRGLVLVEDMISAYKVHCAGLNSVCLMGSHVSMDNLLEILKYGDELKLALDRDATDKAVKLARRFQFIAPHLQVIPLQRDLKYEDSDQIKKIIYG